MSERSASTRSPTLDADELRDWVEQQRWYASKSRHVTQVDLLEAATLGKEPPLLVLALLQTGFATGTHELYQLPLGMRPAGLGGPRPRSPIATDWSVYDALADPELGRVLLRWIDETGELEGRDGRFSFHAWSTARSTSATTRRCGRWASSSRTRRSCSATRLVAKLFRKLEPGVNPELEMLRFLTAHGFENIAPLYGWAEYDGPLAVGHARRGAAVLLGWHRRLGAGARRDRERPGGTSWSRLAALGEVTARMHSTLGSDATDPGVRARGAEPGGAVAADGHGRRGHRADLHPASRPARARADRRLRAGRAGAPLDARPGGHRRARHPHARRLPPRPDPPDPARLGDPRLRGRARALASGAPPEALAAARRGRDAALVRLRGVGHRDPARSRRRRRAGRSARARRSWRTTSSTWRRACCPTASRRSRTCWRCSSSRRRSTSCATRATTGPTGCRSRWRASGGSWRPHDRTVRQTQLEAIAAARARRPAFDPRRAPGRRRARCIRAFRPVRA